MSPEDRIRRLTEACDGFTSSYEERVRVVVEAIPENLKGAVCEADVDLVTFAARMQISAPLVELLRVLQEEIITILRSENEGEDWKKGEQ